MLHILISFNLTELDFFVLLMVDCCFSASSLPHSYTSCDLIDVLSAVFNLSRCLGLQGQSAVICTDLNSWRAARGSSGMAPPVRPKRWCTKQICEVTALPGISFLLRRSHFGCQTGGGLDPDDRYN